MVMPPIAARTPSEYAASRASPGLIETYHAGRPIVREPIQKRLTFGASLPPHNFEISR
jgi:hypothetical protein